MRILVLGPNYLEIRDALGRGDLLAFEAVLTDQVLTSIRPDIVISYGYRHIVRPEVLGAHEIPFINIHVSLLPWNRGADPNLWSWLENTPRGVSLHWMSKELDKGDLIAQTRVHIDPSHTLRSSYRILSTTALSLLQQTWESIENGSAPRDAQPNGGSFHRTSDKTSHLPAMKDGWDTECQHVLDYGFKNGLWLSPS